MDALLTAVLIVGGYFLLRGKVGAPASAPPPIPSSQGNLWLASTFTAAPGSLALGTAPRVGMIAALQDTLHGGGNGSIVLVEVTGAGTGSVRSVIATNAPMGGAVQSSPIKSGDVALFDPSEVLASTPDLASMLTMISQF